jgi:hypothetical protein
MFPQAKIKVEAETKQISVVEYKYPGAKRAPISHPIVLTALTPVNYFQVRPPLSIMNMIMGNPMMLMMIASFGLLLVFPYLTAGLDEEQLKELQGGADAQDPMKNLKTLFGMEPSNTDDD